MASPSAAVSKLLSYGFTANDIVDTVYGRSEATRSTPSRPRDKHYLEKEERLLWRCQFCDRSYKYSNELRRHERAIHKHDATAEHLRWMTNCPSASPWQISKDISGETAITVDLLHKLGSCLSELSSQLPKGSSTLLVHKIDGATTNINVDMSDTVWPKPSTLLTNSGTAQLGPFLGDVKNSEAEPQYAQLQPPPLSRQVHKVRHRSASLAVDHDDMDAVIDQQSIPTIEASKIMFDPHKPFMVSLFDHLAYPSSKDEGKLMGHRTSHIVHDLIKVEPSETKAEPSEIKAEPSEIEAGFSKIEAEFSKKRGNPDGHPSHCSGVLVDSSEEGDDSDYECDNIITWNYSQHDALPSSLPYIRGYDQNTSSPCSDSPESGSTTSGTTSDTPVSSSASGLAGGNGLKENGYTPPSAGTGFLNNGSSPFLGTKEGFRAKVADPQPRPLICWYPAAGIACSAKHIKMSTEVRYLWGDHAWGNDQGPNHRLSDACQRCKRLFPTQQLLEEHVRDIAPQGPCRALSDVELKECNWEPNRRGISRECKVAIEKIRKYIEKETRKDRLRVLRDGEIEKLLEQRVDINVLKQRVASNVSLYINGSNTNERTARSELWKWYLIFKKLRPDDELPENPFVPAQRLVEPEGRSRADALRTFMQVFDKRRMEGCLSQLDDDQRTALKRVFLDTWDMLVANEASKRHPKRKRLSPPEDYERVFLDNSEMLGPNQANEGHPSVQTRGNPRKRQRLPPPEDYGPTPHSNGPTLASTTPALAPAPIPVEIPLSVQDSVNFQHPTFEVPEVQNQLRPQTPSSVPQSFMSDADDLWLLEQQQQQQQQEADAHSLSSTGNPEFTNFLTDYGGLYEFETQDC